MGSQFRYIEIGGDGRRKRYLCLDQNPVRLAFMLYLIGMKGLRRLGCGKKSLGRLLLNQIRPSGNGADLTLPVFGSLCLRVNNGHLAFDLGRKAVVKVFDEEMEKTDIEDEIEKVRRVGKLGFAPRLRRWSPEDRWYEMDYVEHMPEKTAVARVIDFYDFYYRHVESCIEKMVLFDRPVTVLAGDYIKFVIESVGGGLNAERKWDTSGKICAFISSTAERIESGNRPVFLVFSHGDFGSHNILVGKMGMTVIDWEYSSTRPALFDFFSFFFNMRPRMEFIHAPRINEAVESLRSRLTVKSPAIAASIEESVDVYRWSFYVETVCKYLKREMTPEREGKISRTIEAFRSFEREYYHDTF